MGETFSEYLERMDPVCDGIFGGLGQDTEYFDAKCMPVYPAGGGTGGFDLAWYGASLKTRDCTLFTIPRDEIESDGENYFKERFTHEIAFEVDSPHHECPGIDTCMLEPVNYKRDSPDDIHPV